VKLAAGGRFLSGRFHLDAFDGPGHRCRIRQRGAALIEQLSREDLGARERISAPTSVITL